MICRPPIAALPPGSLWLIVGGVVALSVTAISLYLVRRRWSGALGGLARHPFARYVLLSVVAHIGFAVWLLFSPLFQVADPGPGPAAVVVHLGESQGMESDSVSPEPKPWDAKPVDAVQPPTPQLTAQPLAPPAVERPEPVAFDEPRDLPFDPARTTTPMIEPPKPWKNPSALSATELDVPHFEQPADNRFTDANPVADTQPTEPAFTEDIGAPFSPESTAPLPEATSQVESRPSPEFKPQVSASSNEQPDETPRQEEMRQRIESDKMMAESTLNPVPKNEKAMQNDAVAELQEPVFDEPAIDTPLEVEQPFLPEATNARTPAIHVSSRTSTPDLSRTEDTELVAPRQPNGANGQTVQPIYRDRWAENRIAIARARGGSRETELAVRAALKWLSFAQSNDGRWDASQFGSGKPVPEDHDRRGAGLNADTGITGLALLAFLGAGHTHLDGEYAAVMQSGLDFLVREQRRRGDGAVVGNASSFAAMYCHGIATLALCEAWSLTGDDRLADPVRRAVAFTISAQNRVTGGWRYQPQQQGDTSQLGWQLMALTSAYYARLDVPDETWKRAGYFLNSVARGSHGGLATYRPGEARPSAAMTAESMLCRLFLQTPPDHPLIQEAANYVANDLPGNGRVNYYYWYYGTLALYHLQDDRWTRWNAAVKRTLVQRQARDGSWNADSAWGPSGGRVYSTALCALTLEVYYRYRPLSEQRRRENTASR